MGNDYGSASSLLAWWENEELVSRERAVFCEVNGGSAGAERAGGCSGCWVAAPGWDDGKHTPNESCCVTR